MNCRTDIERIAEERYKEACFLLENKMWDGAYYLAGYSIELLLKARICKLLGIDNFFAFDLPFVRKEFYRIFKNHNIQELIVLGGLHDELIVAKKNPSFKRHWSLVINWTEGSRYSLNKNETEVINFLKSIKRIGLWIKGKS